MTATERKLNSDKILKSLGIVIIDELPPLEEEGAIRLRSPQEIAERILILTYLNCIATETNLSGRVVEFLKQEGLWEKTSAFEKSLFSKSRLTPEDETIIRSRGESIWVLLWTISSVDELDLPIEPIDPQDVFPRLPRFLESAHDFIHAAATRPTSVILDQADLIFRLAWAAMQQEKEKGQYQTELNYSVAYERHYAMNWITSVQQEWDGEAQRFSV